ncbi:MAG: Mov34/MPN/PAD-1 family protein [Cycloclasticus sp.]
MQISQTLWINNSMFLQMVAEAEKWEPYETGGVFMGYQADNNDLVVTDLIDAGKNSTHKHFRFSPDQDYQLKKIADVYKKSGGAITYLGDWHTHPNTTPELSWVDKRTLTKIALTPESKNLHPIMVILGGEPEKWTLNSVQFITGAMRPWLFLKCTCLQLQHKSYNEKKEVS